MPSNKGFENLVSTIKEWKEKINKILAIDLNSFSKPITKELKEDIENLVLGEIKSAKDKGDLLEQVIRNLFETLDIAISFKITHKKTSFGQFDFIIDFIFTEEIENILSGITNIEVLKKGINGECKNYKEKVGKELIEQSCWRVCKTKKSLFYVASKYTTGAIDEINFFNSHHFGDFDNICCNKNDKLSIIPLDFNLLRVCTLEEIRFSTVVFFTIKQAKEGRINNILNLK